MKPSLIACVAVALISGSAWSDTSGEQAKKNDRDWTNLDGKTIKAEYLGTREGDVALRLRDGKIVMVPIIKLSNEDNEFMKDNPLAYSLAWQAWPTDAGMMMQYPEVKSEPSDSNGVVYVTPRFRYHCDGNLSQSLMKDHLRSRTPRGRKLPDFGKADEIKFLKSNSVPYLYKVAKVLRMTDAEWATGQPPAGGAPPPKVPTAGGFSYRQPPADRNRLPRLYRTAHLIFYYYIHIEGETGVARIRRFIDENRMHMAGYERYLEDHARYEAEWNAFTALPGLEKLEDGRVRYPAHLKPPIEPKASFTSPDVLKLGGLDALLGGESAEIVGGRIEEALVNDLGINLRFVEHPH